VTLEIPMIRPRTLLLAALLLGPPFQALTAQRRFSEERRRIDTLVPFTKAGGIELELVNGDIVVTGWARDEAKILATTETGVIDAVITSTSIELEMNRPGRARYELMVPIGARVSAATRGGLITISGTKGTVSVESHAGVVEVSDVDGQLDVEVLGGRVTLQRVRGASTVEMMGGSVSLSEVSGDLELEMTAGSARITGADLANFDFRSAMGGLDFSGVLAAQGRHHVETTGGRIVLAFPPTFGAALELETWNGQFHPEGFAVTLQPGGSGGRGRAQRQQFTINGGGARISIETNSGDVYLRRIGATTRRER
jgi:DUF4097 and DUF4098 domain-containing protein YvlB